MDIKKIALAMCLVASGLSGCALTTAQISIDYTPQQGVNKVVGAENIAVSVSVADQRTDKSKVGSKKNGYGMEMAPIVVTEDVASTIRRAIEQELLARGFQLGKDTALVKISADVTRYYNDHKMGFFSGDAVADLNLSVTVMSRNGSTLYSKPIVAQGAEPNTQIAGGDNAKLALGRALENGMKILFEDPAFNAALVTSLTTK
jgi:uncharacterized lipoprotein